MPDPREEWRAGVFLGLALFALVMESLIATAVLCLICDVERRVSVWGAIAALNAITFSAFILWLFPEFPNPWVIEALIVAAEGLGLQAIVRGLTDDQLPYRRAFAISAGSNLLSFLIGLAV